MIGASLGGVLLTGGASRRLGVDKAALRVGDENLAARAARVLRDVCAAVIEVGSGASGLPHVWEEPRGAGPLSALCAGADALATDAVLLLAVDLPRVEPPLLRLVAGTETDGIAVPLAGDREQWVCARYGPRALERAHELLATGTRSLHALAAEVPVVRIDAPEWRRVAPPDAFADVDTAADANRLGISLDPTPAPTPPRSYTNAQTGVRSCTNAEIWVR